MQSLNQCFLKLTFEPPNNIKYKHYMTHLITFMTFPFKPCYKQDKQQQHY